MNTALPQPTATQGWQGLPRHVWAAWRSVRARDLASWLMVALVFGALDSSALLGVLDQPRWPLALARHLGSPMLVVLAIALCWLPAHHSRLPAHQRQALLVSALLMGSLLGLWLVKTLVLCVDWPDAITLMQQKYHKPALDRWHWTGMLGDALFCTLCAGLVVALHEMNRHRRDAEAAMQRSLQAQATLSRKAMAARLATLQAQVDPQFLFDTLVAIEQDYARAAPDAAWRMEQLIRHLRVALPRLRDGGSRLDQEAELLESYLAVRLGPGSPRLTRDWPAELGQLAVPPMVLLPLLQRALSLHADGGAGEVRLSAARQAPAWRISLRFAAAGLCGGAEELARLQQRLQSTTDTPTRLSCESGDDFTEFHLDLYP